MRLSNSQDVSLIQRVLMTLVLRLLMNGGFSFDSANRVFWVIPGFMGKSLVIAVKSSTKRNNKTRSCTWAKRIYIWRLLSCCRAPLKVPCAPKWFDSEFPIIKTTKLVVETRSCTCRSDQFPMRVCSCPLCIINRLYMSKANLTIAVH